MLDRPPQFSMQAPDPSCKSFPILGPDNFLMSVDYDDVWHPAVEAWARWAVKALNRELLAHPPAIPMWEDEKED